MRCFFALLLLSVRLKKEGIVNFAPALTPAENKAIVVFGAGARARAGLGLLLSRAEGID